MTKRGLDHVSRPRQVGLVRQHVDFLDLLFPRRDVDPHRPFGRLLDMDEKRDRALTRRVAGQRVER